MKFVDYNLSHSFVQIYERTIYNRHTISYLKKYGSNVYTNFVSIWLCLWTLEDEHIDKLIKQFHKYISTLMESVKKER